MSLSLFARFFTTLLGYNLSVHSKISNEQRLLPSDSDIVGEVFLEAEAVVVLPSFVGLFTVRGDLIVLHCNCFYPDGSCFPNDVKAALENTIENF